MQSIFSIFKCEVYIPQKMDSSNIVKILEKMKVINIFLGGHSKRSKAS